MGVLFANFYLGHIEENLFNDPNNKPIIYFRYVDDILIEVDDKDIIQKTINILTNQSVLHFTYESEINGAIPFLDVFIQKTNNSYNTSVYTKPTNLWFCLNGRSECPLQYKINNINAFVKRAFTHCNTHIAIQIELERIKQLLLLNNNNHNNALIDKIINKHWSSYFNNYNNHNNNNNINMNNNNNANQNNINNVNNPDHNKNKIGNNITTTSSTITNLTL